MKITNLDPKKYKRFFAFGCSYTNYIWPTWADIIGQDIEFYENWGHPGAGNYFIFNSIIEADTRYNFNSDDLIIVMWSTKEREDRYSNGNWIHATNIGIEEIYGKEWVDRFYIDSRSQLIRDLAYMKSIPLILEHKNTNWSTMSWNENMNSSSLRPFFHRLQSKKKKDEMIDIWKKNSKDVYNGKDIPEMIDDKDVIKLYQDVFVNMTSVFVWFRDIYLKDRKAPNDDLHPMPQEALSFLDWVWPNNTISNESREYVKFWSTKIFDEIDNTKPIFKPNRL